MAAGVLLVTEAGGKVTNYAGIPISIDGREVLATNGLVHAEILSEIQQILAGRVEGLPSVAEYKVSR